MLLVAAAVGSAYAATDVAYQVVWRDGTPAGRVEVSRGQLVALELTGGSPNVAAPAYRGSGAGPARMTVRLRSVDLVRGAGGTIVTVDDERTPFAFFARDVTERFPIVLPAFGVAVSAEHDTRSYAELEAAIAALGQKTKLAQIETEPETSFASASARSRSSHVPTWLGLGRDNRLFTVTPSLPDNGPETDVIQMTHGSTGVTLPEMAGRTAAYGYARGRGQGATRRVDRRLEEGCLPILHDELVDDEIAYATVSFVTLERSPLVRGAVRGTHFLVADTANSGNALTPEERRRAETLAAAEPATESTVLCLQITATNRAATPRYAWLKLPRPGWNWADRHGYEFDVTTGFSRYSADRVFCVSRLNGAPPPAEEVALLLQPGESAVLQCQLPHEPLAAARASALAALGFAERHSAARRFWQDKLDQAGRMRVPEPRVDEMLRAGLLHLDLVTYGREPDDALAPSIGIYSPIGTESAPIMQFYASIGRHDLARRCLMYFLEKQRADGSIQNFSDYVIETGAVLWDVGEYLRYRPDDAWLREIAPKLAKSCEYLRRWRERNQREERKGGGYGMIDGKVADPNDPYHQFMLNAYGYLGLSRMAEALRRIDPRQADALQREATAWRTDIRAALAHSMARSPVVPLANGYWSRTAPPWPETIGPRALYATGEKQFTHGTFATADSLLGPLHLIYGEVLDADEPMARELLASHADLFCNENVAFSQPYYSRHDWIQLRRGMVKPYLRTWYTAFAALADRETYTFWEHFHHVSAHKTHEEAWFLMQTRWMLYLEQGSMLQLFPAVPRAWLQPGQEIVLENVASYFGTLDARLAAAADGRSISATISCPGDRMPEVVLVRVPHPESRPPRAVTGGIYDPVTETVRVAPFSGTARLELTY